ncbi:MAG: protein kinase [Planctomycetes bacterium]|nr:protein kinase [Planctomycetota bacterium]
MSRIKNILFGKIAVSTKFITEEQLDECLLAQRELETRGGAAPRLGEILEQKGYLTRQQIRSLLETMHSMQRRLFGEIAITFHFVTLEQVQTALEIQRYLKNSQDTVPLFGQALVTYRQYLKSMGTSTTLPKVGEVLQSMGYLKPHQVEVILQEQGKKLVDCDNCGASLNISKFKAGQKIKCGQCSSVLELLKDEAGNVEARLLQDREPALAVGSAASPAGAAAGAASAPNGPEALFSPVSAATGAPPGGGPGPGLELKERDKGVELNLQKPATLGDFQVLFRLGQDSTGILYKAQQLSKNRPVVLKLMNPSSMEDPAFSKRFMEEAKKMAGLDHPGIKKIFSIGRIAERFYVAMEYVEGESVHKLLEREGKLPAARAISIASRVGEALAFAWQNGVLHGDLRPSNILVLNSGEVKLAQLGLATKSTENILTISKSGQLAPFYIAPEQVTEDRELDCRTDIYSLGATLFHMITGRPPYQGQSPFEILVRLTEETIPPLKFFDPTIPDSVCKMVEKMLEAEPEERYPSYEQLLLDLRDAEGAVQAAPSLGATAQVAMPPVSPQFTDPGMTPQRPFQYVPAPGEEVGGTGLELAEQAAPRKTIGETRGAASAAPSRMPMVAGLLVLLLVAGGGYYVYSRPQDSGGPVATAFDTLVKDLEGKPQDFVYQFQHIDDFLAQHPNDPQLADARKLRATTERHREESAGREFETLQADIASSISREQYAEALGRFDQWPAGFRTPDWTEKLNLEKAKTRDQISQKFRAAASAIKATFQEKKEFEAARAELAEWQRRFAGIDDLLAQVQAELTTITGWQKKIEEEQQQRKDQEALECSRKCFEETRDAATKLADAMNFEGAADRCAQVEAGSLSPPHSQKLEELKNEFLAQKSAIERLKARLQTRLGDMVTAKAPQDDFPKVQTADAGGEKSAPKRLAGSTADGVDADGHHYLWNELTVQSVYELAAWVTNPTVPVEHLELGLFCLRHGLPLEAEKEFEAFAKNSTDRARVQPYLDLVEEKFRAAAAELLATAKEASARRDSTAALEALLTLRTKYGEREFSRKNAEELEQVFRQAFLGRIVDSSKPGDLYDWSDAGQLGKWSTGKDSLWNVQDGVLTAKGSAGRLDKTAGGNVTELAGMFYVSASDRKPILKVRLGSYEIKIMDTGVVYCKDTKQNLQKNTNEKVLPNTWYHFRILRQKQGTADQVQLLLNDHLMTAFDGSGARDSVSIEFELKGIPRPVATAPIRFDNILVRPDE